MRSTIPASAFAVLALAALASCGGNSNSDTNPSSSKIKSGAKFSVQSNVAPVLEVFKFVANDGNAGAPVYNDWGRNQPRITRYRDGSVRLLYLRRSVAGLVNWVLMKRAAGSTEWLKEREGESTDDVALLRDPVTDLAYVIAFPNSVPTAYASPNFNPSTIPGSWQNFIYRHYTGTGIGTDGRVCMKASFSADGNTTETSIQYICGKYDGVSAWTWGAQVTRLIHQRHAYDYLFPGGYGDPNELVASAQSDVLKQTSAYAGLSGGDYVFNGARQYKTEIGSDAHWWQQPLFDPYQPLPAQPPASAVVPVARQYDTFIDSKRRMFSSYYVESATEPKGFYLSVSDSHGAVLHKALWTQLPQYGEVRIFEDGKHRLWLLWTGPIYSNLTLYPIIENPTPGALNPFTLGIGRDLSDRVGKTWFQGTLLAVPRGGQVIENGIDANLVDGILIACTNEYNVPNTNTCRPDNTSNQQIFHFTIRLPD